MSEVENASSSAIEYPLTVGGRLQQARQAMHMSVADVASQLHITATYVNLIEKNQFNKLPGAIFTRGYIKSYARLVNLSVDDIVACYIEQEGGAPAEYSARPAAVNEYGASMRRHAIKWSIAIVAVILFLPTLAWWYTHQEELEASATIAVAQTATALPVTEPAEKTTNSVELPLPTVDASQWVATPVPTVTPAVIQPTSVNVESEKEKSLLVVTQQPSPSDTASLADALVITFSEKSWIQVKNIEGVTLHDAEHRTGEEITIGGKSPFYVWIKNGKAVAMLFNGKPIKIDNIDNTGVARLVVGK